MRLFQALVNIVQSEMIVDICNAVAALLVVHLQSIGILTSCKWRVVFWIMPLETGTEGTSSVLELSASVLSLFICPIGSKLGSKVRE